MTITLDGVNPELKARIQRLMTLGHGAFTITSALRTYAQQEVLYKAYLKGGALAAKPGTSNHERGLAVDVACDTQHNGLRQEIARQVGLHTPIPSELWHMELDPARLPLDPPVAPTITPPIAPPTKQEATKMIGHPAVGLAFTTSGNGYWICDDAGDVFSFGDAQFFGSMGGKPLNEPIIGIYTHPSGQGYILLAKDGGTFPFGKAQQCRTPDGKGGTDFIK